MAKNQAVAQPKHADLQVQQETRVEGLAAPMEEADELDEAAKGVVDLSLGNVGQTLAEAESSLLVHLELYELLGSKEGMAAAYRNLGVLYQTLGDLAAAEAMHKEALKLDESLDRKEETVAVEGDLGRVYQPREIDLNVMARRKHKEHKPAGIPHRSVGTTPSMVALSGTPVPAAGPDVIELTELNFGSSIDGHPFAVIDIWAPSSALCRAFAPTFAAAAARNPDVLFAQINAEDQRPMVEQFDIRSFPTLIIFRSNIIVYAKPGPLEARALDEVLAAARALDMEQVRRKVVSVDTVAMGGTTAPATDVHPQAAADARPLSIETHLRPSVRTALRDAGPLLAAGGLVAIRDAFDPDFAERMYRSLDSCTTWRLYEGYEEHFHYHHHNVYDIGEFPADLAWCSKIFDSPNTKEWVKRLSTRSCLGPAEVSASWYLPGDHSLPHNDVAANDASSNRQVAFVWHLAKDWRSEWGGALFWCSKGCYLPPVFNTLWLFNVGPESNHFVTRVSPYAQGKRLAVNGWWTGQTTTRNPVWKGPDRIRTDSSEIVIY